MKGNETVRLYAVACALLFFFVAWATVAAHPWTGPEPLPAVSPRAAAVVARQEHLIHRTAVVRRVLKHRWTAYHHRLTRRLAEIDRRAVPAAGDPPPVVVWVGRAKPLVKSRTS